MRPTVPAAANHRESVARQIPLSLAKAPALIAAGPLIFLIILAFMASGYFISVLVLAPRIPTAEAATRLGPGATTLTQGSGAPYTLRASNPSRLGRRR